MVDTRRIPFSEMVERVQKELLRDNSTSDGKFIGYINNMYMYDIPPQIDWRHIRKEAYVTTTADWEAGYISAISGTTVTGDADALWTSANSNNMLLKVSGYDEVYRVTYVGATSLTLDRTWVGDAITTDTGYALVQDRYALATDFDRMILDPGRAVYYYSGGNKVYLTYLSPDAFEQEQIVNKNIPVNYTIKWVSGDPYLYITPPDTQARTLYYVYMPSLAEMKEYTAGTILTVTDGSTAVTGSGTVWTDLITDTAAYDYYFRIDGDGTGSKSVWYKIASASSGTALTLSNAYEGTSVVAGSSAYTISTVSLLPPGIDAAIVYGGAIIGSGEQVSKEQITMWSSVYNRSIDQYKAVEGKKNYGVRRIHTVYEKAGCRR